MIRLEFVLKKNDNASLNEFYEYWLNKHGPLVAKHQEALNIQKYIQLHTVNDELNNIFSEQRGSMQPYEGVAELWWNSREELAAALQSPEGQAAAEDLLEDEKKFIDHAKSPLWLAYDIPQVNPPGEDIVATPQNDILKLYYPLRHLSDLSLEQAQNYWRNTHGPKIRQRAKDAAVLRYIQVHRAEDQLGQILQEARGTQEPPFTGHAELWFDRKELLSAISGTEGQEAFTLFFEDEKNFIDFSRSALWLGKEHIMFNNM